MQNNFQKGFNNQKKTVEIVINDILLHKVIRELDKLPTWEEFMNTVAKLTNKKAQGINNVSPHAFNKMSETNLLHHFNFILVF